MLEFGATPPLGYRWGTNAAYDEWRAGSARLACAKVMPDRPTISRKFADAPSGAVLAGFATRFGKPHEHKGRVEVFQRGCFARSLVAGAPAVSLLLEHWDGALIATTADRLELMQTELGLAFKCSIPDTDRGRHLQRSVASRALTGMSVGYRVEVEETKTIEGTAVRIIRDASLREISVCASGAVSQAYVTLIAETDARPLDEMVKSGALEREASFVLCMRSLARLRERIGEVG